MTQWKAFQFEILPIVDGYLASMTLNKFDLIQKTQILSKCVAHQDIECFRFLDVPKAVDCNVWKAQLFGLPGKGQIISECPYEIIVYPKITTKKFPRFLSWKFTTSRLTQKESLCSVCKKIDSVL